MMTAMTPSSRNKPQASRKFLWVKILFPLLVLGLGAGLGNYFMATRPVAVRAPASAPKPLVLAVSMHGSQVLERLRLMGTVMAERSAEVRTPVAGTLVAAGPHFYPGGRVRQGEMLAVVDPSDYEIAVARAKAALEKAEADLALEKGRAAMAEAEVKTLEKLTGEPMEPTDLTLRGPQMRQMRAAVAAAGAELAMAELQLARTRVAAPFAAVLTRRHVEAGSRVSTGEALATLVGRERFWIEARVPLDRVGAMRQEGDPEGPSKAWIHSASGETREGHVFRILPELSESARMVRVLVVVSDPLGEKGGFPLFLGDFLSLDVAGRRLGGGYYLPHAALREGDRIWVLDAEGRLRIVGVEVLFSETGGVYVKAPVEEGTLLVVSDLGFAVEGMVVEMERADLHGEASPAGKGA